MNDASVTLPFLFAANIVKMRHVSGEAYSKDVDRDKNCHTPFRERGNEASIRVLRMFKSHV
jgi:hypothetical protein